MPGMFQATIRFGLGSDTVWSARSRHELAPQGTLPFDGSCFKRTGKIDERFLTRHEGVRVRPTAAMIGVYKAPGAAPLKWVDATVPTAADWANGLHFPDLWFEVKKETPVPPLDPAVEERRRVSASVYNIATGKRGWLSCQDGVWAVCMRPGAHIWGLRPHFKGLLWVRTRSTHTYAHIHLRELYPELREAIRVDLGMLT